MQISDQEVANGIVERVLLAEKARELGFQFDGKEVLKQLRDRKRILVSRSVNSGGRGQIEIDISRDIVDDEGKFDTKKVEDYVQNDLRRSLQDFQLWQEEELLARRMRQVMTESVTVSPKEVWASYARDENYAKIEYAGFERAFFESQVALDQATVDTWARENQAVIDKEWEAVKDKYKEVPLQAWARQILIAKTPSEQEGPDAPTSEQAKKKAEDLLKRLKAGADFAVLARSESDHPSAGRGGDIGYQSKDTNPVMEDVIDNDIGLVDEVIESPVGFHVIEILGKREGEVKKADAVIEIARELYIQDASDILAKKAASEVHAAMVSGASLEDAIKTLAEKTGYNLVEDTPELAPTAEQTGRLTAGDAPIPGDDVGKITKQALSMSIDAPLADVQKTDVGYVVFNLIERQKATKETFTAEKEKELRDQLLATRRVEYLRTFVAELRKNAEKKNSVEVDPKIFGDEEAI